MLQTAISLIGVAFCGMYQSDGPELAITKAIEANGGSILRMETPLGRVGVCRIMLKGGFFDDAFCEKLSVFRDDVEWIILDQTRISDKGLKSLSVLSRLESMALIGNKNIKTYSFWPTKSIRTLLIANSCANNDLCLELKKLTCLDELTLSNMEIEESATHAFGELSRLKYLDLTGNKLSAKGLLFLKRLEGLEELILDKNRISGKELEVIGMLKNLRHLSLFETDAQNGDLGFLESMVELKDLNLRRTSISNLEFLKSLAKIENINLSGTRITNRDMLSLSKLRTVRHLNISDTVISDEGIEVIGKLPLRYLDVSSTKITERAIAVLMKIPSLKILDLSHTAIVDEQLQGLKTANPDLLVVR